MSARAAGDDDLAEVLDAEEPLDDEARDEAPLDDEEEDPFLDDEEPDVDALEDDLEPELDAEDPEDGDVDGVEESLEPTLAADEGDDEDEDAATGVTVVPPDAEFDADDPVPAVDDEDDDEIEGLRDGEFVCRGCFMAKRETQLADPDKLLCRDCA
ncbi:MAG: hypothetical protein ACNA8R_06625 [Nitriliruptoraceae bacterium]